MPIIKPQHVVSFSNAETNHPAENLLKPEGTYKWKVPPGKPATVVLQFEKVTEIHSIDIGNEGSAFVEVLVGKSTATSEQDYEVLLVASSFMTPVESRNETNRNSVRMFGPEKLNKSVAAQKWDRVKIVCTQPFNKTASYGLSFITFHSPPAANEQKEKESGAKKIGAFTLKPESEDPISTGSIFGKKKEVTTPLTGAAAVRAASKLAEESRGTPGKNTEIKPVKKEATLSDKPSTSQGGSKRKHAVSDDEDEAPPPRPPMKKQSTSISSVASSSKGADKPKIKRTKSDTSGHSKPFHKLMEGVVFVLSGFQNPFRGELRDKAQEMGAEYKPDWKKGCTHLICAFQNTPKYNQVKGKGKIVKKEWIQHMYKQKTALPWRKYRLGDADTPEGTSEEESENEDHTPAKKQPVKNTTSKEKDKQLPEKQSTKSKSKKGVNFDEDTDLEGGDAPYGGDTDSGGDTEDELERVKAKLASESKDSNPYGDSTDEDEPAKKSKPSPSKNTSDSKPSTSQHSGAMKTGEDSDDSGLPELPDYFTDKHFFLYGDFPGSERRLLTRYITAYDGEIEEYMNDKVHFVITNSDWDKNFDDALSDHPQLVFVKPKWIHMCHEKEKLMPYQHYIVIPNSD
uniref:DNA repair protein XRCC1 n=1 Tax=Crassostrea virginica TaxID=6565 RepID=A0A8B8EMB1_CRAVI|nr:DNA repair protein XRCC1-like [Crassostrea virginica]